jgi:hypothetical protein
MIKKTKKGHQVTSEKGKPLSADDLTASEAEKRLAQVEYFKARDAGKAKAAKRWARS